MGAFKKFLEDGESPPPSNTTADMGKPEGGPVPKKKPSEFAELFGDVFKDLNLSPKKS